MKYFYILILKYKYLNISTLCTYSVRGHLKITKILLKKNFLYVAAVFTFFFHCPQVAKTYLPVVQQQQA